LIQEMLMKPTMRSRRRFLVAAILAGFAGAAAVSHLAVAQETKTAPKPKAKAKAFVRTIKPTYENVPYGDHPRQVIDFYQAESRGPTPLVLYIHGGGWMGGDKEGAETYGLKRLLDHGISVAAINYRFISQADEAGVSPPVKWPIGDAVRALQFVRSKAGEWNIDKTRVGATGGSAGACSSLWLAYHDDMAQPNSPDPIARESTRLTCAAVVGAQTSLDPKQLREWMPNATYGGHAFGFRKPEGRDKDFQNFYEHRADVLKWIKEYSPYELVGPGDPPVYLDYTNQDPPVPGTDQKDPTHSAVMGLMLQKHLKENHLTSYLTYKDHTDKYKDCTAFLIAMLKPESQ
jgi:acetyl esterase/lipase